MSEQGKKSRRSNPAEASARAYAAFVGQIELLDVWLRSARVANEHGPVTPDHVSIHVESNADWMTTDAGFRAFQAYRLWFQGFDVLFAEVEVAFGLEFSSQEPMTDEIFGTFSEFNLPLNTWPYLREFVATTTGRMGWTAATLPTFKVGTRSSTQATTMPKTPGKADASPATRTKRRRPNAPSAPPDTGPDARP